MLNTTRMAGSTAALAAAAAAAATGSSDAAAQGRPPQASTWSGVYIGGSVGGSWLNSDPKGSSLQIGRQGYSGSGRESVGETSATN